MGEACCPSCTTVQKHAYFFLPFLLASLSLQMLQVVWLRKMTIFNVVVVIVTK